MEGLLTKDYRCAYLGLGDPYPKLFPARAAEVEKIKTKGVCSKICWIHSFFVVVFEKNCLFL